MCGVILSLMVCNDEHNDRDLRRAGVVIDELLPILESKNDSSRKEKFLSQYSLAKDFLEQCRENSSFEGTLRTQILHGDLAHYNVVAKADKQGRPVVTGVIDFGDAMCSWTVAELAVAIVSGIASQGVNTCALHEACSVLKGFLSVYSLNEAEIMALWPLVVLRSLVNILCISKELQSDPSNQYNLDGLGVEWRIFDRIAAVPVEYAQEALRRAAKLPASSVCLKTAALLSSSVSLLELDGWETQVVDLSVESSHFFDGNWLNKPEEAVASALDSTHKASTTSKQILVLPYGVAQMHLSNTNSFTEPDAVALGLHLHFRAPADTPAINIRAPFDCSLMVSGRYDSSVIMGLKHADGAVLLISGQLALLSDPTFDESSISFTAGQVFATVPADAHLYVRIVAYPFATSVRSEIPLRCSVGNFPVWRRICPDPSVLLGVYSSIDIRSAASASEEEVRSAEAVAARSNHVASVQEHYYKQPPRIERGFRQHLYSPTGRGYLDMVNNVAVLGHCHSAVFAAATSQMRLLNTNSRFIYKQLAAYADKIISTMPTNAKHLNAVLFVNSGSEATDLAMRIARTVATFYFNMEQRDGSKKRALCRDTICLEGAYHGVTTASDEVSTTLNDNPHALESRPDWIHLAAMPNPFRGKFPYDMPNAAAKYADLVTEIIWKLREKGRIPACYIAEPLSGNAGGVELPPGYLKKVYKDVRAAGGLCISDEVQVGYGRLGSHFWGFQEHGVVPDILTMAKAAGNGHPLGFVVTSKENVKIFAAESGSFFSSAGGGPVSCAIGSAVLDTVIAENLQGNAAEVGAYLNAKLKLLAEKHSHIVGCIHGHGLYQGIELVRTRSSAEPSTTTASAGKCEFPPGKTPASEEAYAICERLLELGVICHNTGDYSNVLKVKPPLGFTKSDADFFVQALDICFRGW